MIGKVSTMVKTIFLTVTVMSLLLVSVPTVSAKKLKFSQNVYPSPPPVGFPFPDWFWYPDPAYVNIQPQPGECCWGGSITGDIIAHSYFWYTDGYKFTGRKGTTEHFFEDFLIVFDDNKDGVFGGDDGWIVGLDKGIIAFMPGNKKNVWKYHTEGPITDASEKYAYMIGYIFHEEELLSFWDPNYPEALFGIGTASITP